MDPFTIAATVTQITATCLSTGKTIYDLTCKYNDAPRTLVAISSEVTVVSASLSRIQALVLSKNPEKILRSNLEVATALDTSLTGCMVLVSCLDQEIRAVSRHALMVDGLSWKGKFKAVWKQETFRDLLDGIRGQQLAINTLIQLLQMESLAEITQLLEEKSPDLKKTVARTVSLRRSHPSVRVADSIYAPGDHMSISAATADSAMAPSDLEFDFDDIVVNSAAYRRVLAAASHQNLPPPLPPLPEAVGDLIDFTDSQTITGIPSNVNKTFVSQDLRALDLSSTGVSKSLLQVWGDDPQQLGNRMRDDYRTEQLSGPHTHTSVRLMTNSITENSTPAPFDHRTSRKQTSSVAYNKADVARMVFAAKAAGVLPVAITGHLLASTSITSDWTKGNDGILMPTKVFPYDAQRLPRRTCGKCKKESPGEFIQALGKSFHPECFTCHDCGQDVATKFLPFPARPPFQYPLCEQDYFRRLDLLCCSCNGPLRGSYITVLKRNYHVDHFGCSASCEEVFGDTVPYYAHKDEVFCAKHYATLHAETCKGCQLPILGDSVKPLRNPENRRWHRDCHVIYEQWKLPHTILGLRWGGMSRRESSEISQYLESSEAVFASIRHAIGTFKTKTVQLVSRLILALNAGPEGLAYATAALLSHCGALLEAVDRVFWSQERKAYPISGVVLRETDFFCAQVKTLLQRLVQHHESSTVSPDLMPSLGGIVWSLRSLTRSGLDKSGNSIEDSLRPFLQELLDDEAALEQDLTFYKDYARTLSDECHECGKEIELFCFKNLSGKEYKVWHTGCLPCRSCNEPDAKFRGKPLACTACGSRCDDEGIFLENRLTHYKHLMWVAFARMMAEMGLDHGSLLQETPQTGTCTNEKNNSDAMKQWTLWVNRDYYYTAEHN